MLNITTSIVTVTACTILGVTVGAVTVTGCTLLGATECATVWCLDVVFVVVGAVGEVAAPACQYVTSNTIPGTSDGVG